MQSNDKRISAAQIMMSVTGKSRLRMYSNVIHTRTLTVKFFSRKLIASDFLGLKLTILCFYFTFYTTQTATTIHSKFENCLTATQEQQKKSII